MFGLEKQRLLRDIITVYKYIGGTNTREGTELLSQRKNVDTKTNASKLTMNKLIWVLEGL